MKPLIYGISFPEEGVVVMEYGDPADLRVKGMVARSCAVRIDLEHPDYREDADLLMAQAQRLLRNCLADFEESEPHIPAVDDRESGKGMGWGDES